MDAHDERVRAGLVVDGEARDASRAQARAHLGEDVVVSVDVLLQLARAGSGDEDVARHVGVAEEAVSDKKSTLVLNIQPRGNTINICFIVLPLDSTIEK